MMLRLAALILLHAIERIGKTITIDLRSTESLTISSLERVQRFAPKCWLLDKRLNAPRTASTIPQKALSL